MSCTSKDVSLRPAAPVKVDTVKRKRETSGSPPEERPPNVLSLSPFARSLDTSQLGT